jgi:hypothetical protein
MGAAESLPRPVRCPVCKGTILYLDGEPCPALIFRSSMERPLVAFCVGCERCVSKEAPPKRPHLVRKRETRPPGQIVRDDARAVVGWVAENLDDGLRLIDQAATWLRRITKGP